MTFQSLGVAPLLKIELADRGRFHMLGWGIALAAFLVGAAITRRSVWTKIKYILALALIAMLVPAVWDSIATAWVCNMLFFAACWLVPFYLLVGIVRWSCALCCRAGKRFGQKTLAAATVLAMVAGISACKEVNAQDAAKPTPSPYVIQVVEPSPPVKVPDDAIIVPYDPASRCPFTEEEKAAAKKPKSSCCLITNM